MARGRVSVFLLAAFVFLSAGSTWATAQGSIVLPNLIDPKIKLPTILPPKEGPVSVSLPDLGLPGVSLLETVNLPPNLGLPKGDPLLLINLPGVSIVVPNVPQLAQLGSGVLGTVLDQLAPVNQLLASRTGLNLISPLEQLIDGLTAIDNGPSSGLPPLAQGAGGLQPLPISNLWMWNAVTFGSGSHSGFQFQAQAGDTITSGTTLPVKTSDRAEMPGLIWDATKEAGLKSGTLHLGLVGGVAEMDLDIEGDASLKGLGIIDAGSANVRSWSVGGFALLTTSTWYAGSAVGGSWGSTEAENFVVASSTDFGVNCFTSALFLGTIVPISESVRVDFRGTAGYQRTVGEAHADTLGIDYSDHVIESATGSLSARLFGVIREAGVTVRPYVQGGVAHRFHYANDLEIEGVEFSFEDADTSLFAAGGLDFEIDRTVQLSIGVRGDHSEDFDNVAGRVGLLLMID